MTAKPITVLVLILAVALGATPVTPDEWTRPCGQEVCSLEELTEKISAGGPDRYYPTAEVKPCDYNGDGYFDLVDAAAFQQCWPEGG
jgi:hypothetical protein